MDDGSTDNTEAIAKTFVTGDNRVRYHKNATNQGLPRTRNIGVSLASGDLILFTEDDIVLEKDCLKVLISTYDKLSLDRIAVGAICPSLVTYVNHQGTQRAVLDKARTVAHKQLVQIPCLVDKRTGLIYRNFCPTFKGLFEVEDCHACSLYPKQIFDNGMQYAETAFIGNYIGEESDFHFRLRKKGYKLLFEPGAVLHHHVENGGGCRLPMYQWSYYFARNHVAFLVRNYRLRSVYMVPLFFGYCVTTLFRYAFEKKKSSPTASI